MTNQEKWNKIVQKIEELGDELQEISDSFDLDDSDFDRSEMLSNIENALMGLRMAADDLSEQEIPES